MKALPCLLLMLLSRVAFAAPAPESFGYALPLETAGGSGLARVVLPAEVYQGLAREGLADLRVVDAAGSAVPHAIAPLPAPDVATNNVALRVFPMFGGEDLSLDTAQVRVERRGDQISVQLEGPGRRKGSPARNLRGYLVDLGEERPALTALRFRWPADADSGILVVRVERSDDLNRWAEVTEPVTLASLHAQGETLLRDTAEFSAMRARYLRLTFPGAVRVPALDAVHGAFSATPVALPRQWQDVLGRAAETGGGAEGAERVFDLGGALPVDRLQWPLTDASAVAPVEILSRRKESDPWSVVTRATFYRITQATRSVVNPDVHVPVSRHRYWKVRSLAPGATLPGEVVRVGWQPDHVVFVLQGRPPYRLIYGHARAEDAALPIETLVPGWGTPRAPAIVEARTGAQQVLAGPDARNPPADVRRWALWAALVAGVALLAWMAWSLMRQMKAGGDRQ